MVFSGTHFNKKYASTVLLCLLTSLLSCPGRPEPEPKPQKPVTVPEFSDGQNAPFASGPTFLINELTLSQPETCPDQNNDGQADCGVNRSWQAFSGTINNALAANLTGGGTLMALELTGLELPYTGNDEAVTLRIYPCVDADNDPTNTFCNGDGCGEVLAKRSKLEDGQSPYFSEATPLIDNRFSARIPKAIDMVTGDFSITLESLAITFLLPLAMVEIQDGQMCGIASARDLNQIDLPICEWLPLLCTDPNMPQNLSETELLVLFNEQPEIDIDGDGLEHIEIDDQAQVARCIDGDGRSIEGEDCLEDPGLVDGYVLCFDFHAVSGQIIGIKDE